MGRTLLDGCRAVASCVAYNALFGLAVVLTFLGLAAAAWLAEAAGASRESAAALLALGPVVLAVLFWLFYLRGGNVDWDGDGGD